MDVTELTHRLEELIRHARSGEPEEISPQADRLLLGKTISSRAEMHSLFSAMQLTAKTSIDALDNGDYCTDTRGQSPSQSMALSTGVRYQVVYATVIFDQDAHLEATLSAMEQGEDARVSNFVPSRLLIRDRTEVLVISNGYPNVDPIGFHTVHPVVVSYLCTLFDMIWERAIPAAEHRLGSIGLVTPDQVQLLKYLVLGRTDASIARSLGVSTRTVQRQIQTLQQRLGARGRFQLGVRVGKFLAAQGAEGPTAAPSSRESQAAVGPSAVAAGGGR